jgi:drug/metabolite transporter (DMT)-like permease
MKHNIVHPWFRPLDPNATLPRRRRLGFVMLALGIVIVLLGDFVSFGHWLFGIGSCLMLVSLFLLGLKFRSNFR